MAPLCICTACTVCTVCLCYYRMFRAVTSFYTPCCFTVLKLAIYEVFFFFFVWAEFTHPHANWNADFPPHPICMTVECDQLCGASSHRPKAATVEGSCASFGSNLGQKFLPELAERTRQTSGTNLRLHICEPGLNGKKNPTNSLLRLFVF